MTDKIIDSPEYVGQDRRHNERGRRSSEAADVILVSHKSFTWVISVVTFVGVLISWGVSWGTTRATINTKVDKETQLRVDVKQDMERESMKMELLQSRRDIQLVISKLDSIGARVSQMYCEGKPRSCR